MRTCAPGKERGLRGKVRRTRPAASPAARGGTSGSHLPEWQGDRKWRRCWLVLGPEEGTRAGTRPSGIERATEAQPADAAAAEGPARTLCLCECIVGTAAPGSRRGGWDARASRYCEARLPSPTPPLPRRAPRRRPAGPSGPRAVAAALRRPGPALAGG